MNETRHKERLPDEERQERTASEGEEGAGEATAAAAPEQEESATTAEADDLISEADILRSELTKVQQEQAATEKQVEEFKDKYLRARADLENYRRRATQELERAREGGIDSAVLAVLAVYDDLGRALEMAVDDPTKLIPGVEAVLDGLRRNLEGLGIKEVGAEGETFDPSLHEALGTSPSEDESQAGTIANVYQVGFMKDDRLIRPARVIVYESS